MQFRDNKDRLKPLSAFSHSSLTDIVMLLLIFFLLTSSFVANYGIQVNIPKAESSNSSESSNLTVTISSKGEYYVGSKRVSSANLAESIRNEIKPNAPQPTLVIRSDKEATVDQAVRVMNIGKALNLKIVMATEQGIRR